MMSMLLLGCSDKPQPICIGFSANLTGSGSDLGVSGMYGAMLAVSIVNNNGGANGREIYLNIKNDKANPDIALASDRELISEGCPIIVGHMISSVTETVIPFINSSNYLMVSPTIATESLSKIDDNFVRLIPSNINQIIALSKLINRLDLNSFGILYDSNNQLFANTFVEWLDAETNGEVTQLNHILTFKSNEEIAYDNIIEELNNKKIKQLLIISSGDMVAKFAQNFNKRGIEIDVILPTWALSDALIIKGGNAVEGYSGINFYDINNQNLEYIEYKNQLLEQYNFNTTFSSIMAYEAVMLITEAIRSTKSIDPETLKQHIVKANTYNGLFNDLKIDHFGDAKRTIKMYRIVDRQFSEVIP